MVDMAVSVIFVPLMCCGAPLCVSHINLRHMKCSELCIFQELNAVLATRSYFVGNSQTLADIVLYYVLHGVMVSNQSIFGLKAFTSVILVEQVHSY